MSVGDAYPVGMPTGGLNGVTIGFKDGKITQLGQDIVRDGGGVADLAKNTGGIRVQPPGFGGVGIGPMYTHDQTKDAAAGTLDTAWSALQDYQTALDALDKNYQKVDKDNDGIIKL